MALSHGFKLDKSHRDTSRGKGACYLHVRMRSHVSRIISFFAHVICVAPFAGFGEPEPSVQNRGEFITRTIETFLRGDSDSRAW